MNMILSFGTYDVPPLTDDTLSASYTVPSLLPKNILDKISSQEEIGNIESVEDEVTHEVFFGENIKRLRKTLFPPAK